MNSFCYDDFPEKELYCVERWIAVDEEGEESAFFDSNNENQIQDTVNTEEEEIEVADEARIRGSVSNLAEEISLVENMGFDVDDDNRPAPENVPTAVTTASELNEDGTFVGQAWGWSGMCQRKSQNLIEDDAKIKHNRRRL